MPECRNCGAFVTDDYERVVSPAHIDGVRACPRCPDMVREGGRVRRARSDRTEARGVEAGESDVPAKTDGGVSR